MASHMQRTWTQADFLSGARTYGTCVRHIVQCPIVAAAVANAADPSEADALAGLLVRLTMIKFPTTANSASNRGSQRLCLALIRQLVIGEFKPLVKVEKVGEEASPVSLHNDQSGAIMRGNTLTSKLAGQFVRHAALDYIKSIVSPFVNRIVHASDASTLDLEVDPRRLSCEGAHALPAVLAEQHKLLSDTAQSLLDHLTSAESLAAMPRDVRAVGGIIWRIAAEHGLAEAQSLALVGGFIMLRVFSPALVTPESWGVVEDPPSPRARRNLVLLVKLLQNASNGVLFSAKEAFMQPLNAFVEGNRVKMHGYLAACAADPLDLGWDDILLPDSGIAAPELDLTKIDLQDLFELHRQLAQMKPKLVPALLRLKKEALQEQAKQKATTETSGGWTGASLKTSGSSKGTGTKEMVDAAVEVLQQLGPPPFNRKRQHAQKEEALAPPTPLSVPLRASKTETDAMAELERSQWLYLSGDTKKGFPVVYAIINRLDPAYFADDLIQFVLAHVFRVLDTVASQQSFVVCLDMSYARLTQDMRKILYRRLNHFRNMFSHAYRKNLAAIYVIHPSPYTRAMLTFMRRFTSKKLKEKVFECYSWKDLSKHIDFNQISLPVSSQDFITKSYRVVKTNAREKKQERLIKFTLDSLLNIDPRTRRIQNERELSEVRQIICSSDAGSTESGEAALLELELHFDEEAVAMNRKRMMKAKGMLAGKLSQKQSSADLTRRRYTCRNIDDREDILIDIFSAGFALQCRAAATQLPQEYRVIKYNPQKKPQDRVFKLTCDSLMNLDPANRKIKTEIPFAGILSVSLDKELPTDVLWLHLKAEDTPRKIICNDFAAQLCQALQDCLRRYQVAEAFDEQDEFRMMDSASVVDLASTIVEPVQASPSLGVVSPPRDSANAASRAFPQAPAAVGWARTSPSSRPG